MDHTQYLQDLLNQGGNVVIPAGEYHISNPLYVGDNTHVICDAGTVLKLSDNANCPILVNRIGAGKTYTKNVCIEGGIWDGNNLGQQRDKYPEKSPRGADFGQLMAFTAIKDLTIRSLTIKDPNSFGIQLTDTERFTVSDILFDCNKGTLNQDGLHVNGWAKDGYVHNLKGNTNDDFVALNADEGEFNSPENDIENVVIDGIWGGEDGWTAVRLLSRLAKVHHVTIRNIFGAYKYNVVSFTHWSDDPIDFGYFDDILIESVHASSCRTEGSGHGGLFWFQNDTVNVGTVVIRDVFRTESADRHNTTSLIEIGDRVKIDTLLLSSLHEKIPDAKPLLTRGEDVCIGHLTLDGERLQTAMIPLKR